MKFTRYLAALVALAFAPGIALAQSSPITMPIVKQGKNLQEATGVVVLNTDGTAGGKPVRASSTTTNGTVATANTFQSALAANTSRKGCAIYNNSTNAELIFLGAPASATSANSIPLPAGSNFNCGSFQGIVLTDQISITSATVSSTFVVVSQ